MAIPSWFTAKNTLLLILLLGGYALLIVQQSIEISKGNKFIYNDFHTQFTTSFVFGSLIVTTVTGYLLYDETYEDLFRYLILVGAIGGIALSMIHLHFVKLRLNYATMD